MGRPSSHACSNYEINPMIDAKVTSPIVKNDSDNSEIMEKAEESLEKRKFSKNPLNFLIRGIFFMWFILFLWYYGSKQFNVLETGQILRENFSSRRTIIMFRFGYSVLYSIMLVSMTGMFVYSIILKRPRFSLPLIGFFLTEIVCDFCNVIVTIWYFFKYLQLHTALTYIVGLLLLILIEIWMWFGVLNLSEFSSHAK